MRSVALITSHTLSTLTLKHEVEACPLPAGFFGFVCFVSFFSGDKHYGNIRGQNTPARVFGLGQISGLQLCVSTALPPIHTPHFGHGGVASSWEARPPFPPTRSGFTLDSGGRADRQSFDQPALR